MARPNAWTKCWAARSPRFLKELYVSAAARRRGVGRMLMEHLRTIAEEQGCSRLEWTTDQENTEAQSFYDALGAQRHDGKVFYRTPIPPLVAGLGEPATTPAPGACAGEATGAVSDGRTTLKW
ncbi:GNAT family N-acetyltransferase [Frankia sp. Cr2]|uniref:GNAT family N-acetyltransferase n=1 Tax=Frankia sp. Cr2 TaxID=3073932 RepID=UPI002AD28EBD|nr:GNAT family N-acetyltransferase [Frankia sp. Cr2]